MSHSCTYNKLRKVDPTGTLLLRNAFVREVDKRFHKVAKAIYESVYTNNCLALSVKDDEKKGFKVNAPLKKHRFEFSSDPEKVTGFMNWLDDEMDRGILTVTKGQRRKKVGDSHWSDQYIGLGYKSGLSAADKQLKRVMGGTYPMKDRSIDAAFSVPFHADRVGMLYTRTFTDLKGITDDMDTIISRSLAEGMAEGRGPYQMAQILMRRLDGEDFDLEVEDSMGRTISGIQRARTLARTETIRAYAESSLNMYEEAGLIGVGVEAEWLATDDDRVCSECEDMEGQVFPIEDAHGMIPAHPNCRCSFIPLLNPEE